MILKCSKCNEEKTRVSFLALEMLTATFQKLLQHNYVKTVKTVKTVMRKEQETGGKNIQDIKAQVATQNTLIAAIRRRITMAKSNNKRSNYDFNIEDAYMFKLWKSQDGKCNLSGNQMLLETNTPYTLSIDKIIPAKGYAKGNVQWVTWAVNRAKGDLPTEQFNNMISDIYVKCNDYRNPEQSEEVE